MIAQKLNFYRLHFINRVTGQIAHSYEFHAASDDAARQFAQVWEEEGPMELWGPKGRLGRWPAQAGEAGRGDC